MKKIIATILTALAATSFAAEPAKKPDVTTKQDAQNVPNAVPAPAASAPAKKAEAKPAEKKAEAKPAEKKAEAKPAEKK